MGKLSSILVVGAVLGIVIWLRPAHDLPSVSAREQIRHDVLAAERQADARADVSTWSPSRPRPAAS